MESYRLKHFRQVLGDRYQFQAFLGRGAFASVYLVLNLKLKRREALKILADSFEADSTARFVAEATMVASLDHPNIVQVYDYGEVEGVIWYSMQYIEGPMLRDEMWARKRFDTISAVRLAIPLLGALDASHRRGIIHRDLKPSNIILNREGRPYLMDFGIAKADDGHLKTMTGSVLGTPAFMAPEQAEGRPLDGRADLYALGLVLYQMLAGRSPFDVQEPVQLLLLRLREDPPRLATFIPTLDPELEAIIMKTLARDREERFASARELERHLVAFLGDGSDLPPLELVAPVFELQPLEAESAPAPGSPQAGRPPSNGATISLGPGGRSPGQPALVTNGAVGSSVWTKGRSRRMWAASALVLLVLLAFGGVALLGGSRFAMQAKAPPVGASRERAANPNPSLPADLSPKSAAEDVRVAPAGARPTEPVTPPTAAALPSPKSETPLRKEPAPQESAPASPPVSAVAPRRPVRFPRLVEQPEPILSGDAVALCAGTSVILSIQVGEDGRPERVRSLGSSRKECSAPAEAAAKLYRFEPAKDIDDRPVAATTTLTVSFGGLK